MAYYRSVVSGRIGGLVSTRSVFTWDGAIALPDTVQTAWALYWTPMWLVAATWVTSSFALEQVEHFEYTAGHWVSIMVVPVSGIGNGTGDYHPNSVAAVLIAKAPGLRKIGRKFWSGIIESGTTANSLISAALVDFALCAVHYITPRTTPNGSTLKPGIMDKNGVFHQFAGGVISSLLGSMRRRKPGLGI